MDDLLKSLGNCGLVGILVGVLVWFLRHLVVVTLPRLTETFREQMSLEREDCRQRIGDEREIRVQEFTAFMGQVEKLCEGVIRKIGKRE